MLNIPAIEPDIHKKLFDELKKLEGIQLPSLEINVLDETQCMFAGAVEIEVRESRSDGHEDRILFYFTFDWDGKGYLRLPNNDGSVTIEVTKLPREPSGSFSDWTTTANDLIARTAAEVERRIVPLQNAIKDLRSLLPENR